MTPEGRVKEKVKVILKEFGVWYAMPVAGSFGRAGVPDFICCCRGRFFAVETKAGRGKTTKIQDYEATRIRDSGGAVLVVNELGLADLRMFLAALPERELRA